MSDEILKKIIELTKTVEKYNYQYYVLDDPLVPDYEYDRINHELMDLEKQYPQYIQPNSPSFRIGGAGELTLMPNSLDLTHGPWTREDLEEMWESMQAVLPKDAFRDFRSYVPFTDGEGETVAYVLPADPGGSQWEICLDPADMGDRDYFLETVLHEYCHYLTLNHRQADYRGEPTVETYCEDGMVSREGSYLDDFCQRFWTGYLDDRLADLDSYNFFLRHEEDFVSSYASTDPSEDISESFAFFVLWDVPESEAVWAEKLRFFLDYPELTEFRRQVRENLGLEQPEQAA